MGAVGYRFGRELRGRWRAWLGVALLLGAFGGAATAAAAGARRTDTAYQRFSATHQGADLMADEFIPNPDAAPVSHAQVAATPGVADAEQVRSFGFEGMALNGGDPRATMASLNEAGIAGVQLVATPDGRAYGTGLDRPKLLAGRLANPADPSEVTMDFTFPGSRVGDRLDAYFTPSLNGDPHQPDESSPPRKISFRIVGIVAVPGQFPPRTPTATRPGPPPTPRRPSSTPTTATPPPSRWTRCARRPAWTRPPWRTTWAPWLGARRRSGGSLAKLPRWPVPHILRQWRCGFSPACSPRWACWFSATSSPA